PVSNLFCRVTGPGHALDVAMNQVGMSIYHGELAPLPRGKYSLVLMVKAGDTERVLLRRDIAVAGSQAADAAELRLQPPNLALLREIGRETGGDFDAPVSKILQRTGATVTTYHSVESLLLPLAIILMLGEVYV